MDVTTALATSSAFAGLAILKTTIGVNLFSFLLGAAVIVSVLHPVLKVSEGIDRYSRLHYAWGELHYAIESLLADMRRQNSVTESNARSIADISERYRNLSLEDDPGPNRTLQQKFEEEVKQAIPENQLWLPAA